MSIPELFIIAVGLSMDAFAVSVCKGLSMRKLAFKNMLIIGLYFGIFQAGMPLIGYLIGSQFAKQITAIDHWIAFVLLTLIGAKMMKDSFAPPEPNCDCDDTEIDLRPKVMLPLAIATSIDALAVGISFAFLDVSIVPAVSFIGIITLVLSILGVRIGHVFGIKYKSKAEFAGGLILMLMGLKILLDHLGVLG